MHVHVNMSTRLLGTQQRDMDSCGLAVGDALPVAMHASYDASTAQYMCLHMVCSVLYGRTAVTASTPKCQPDQRANTVEQHAVLLTEFVSIIVRCFAAGVAGAAPDTPQVEKPR